MEADDAGGGGAVLKLVERVPLAEPLDEEDEAVLAGDAAVGTRPLVAPQPPPIPVPENCNIKAYITLYDKCQHNV